MVIRNPRHTLEVIVRLAESARVRELQADQEPVERAKRLAVRFGQLAPQRGQPLAIRPGCERLIRIGPPVRPHGCRLAAPNELGPTPPKIPPPPQRMLGGRAV